MKYNRRTFLKSSIAAGAIAHSPSFGRSMAAEEGNVDAEAILKAAHAPVLSLESLTNPVIIDSISLLNSGKFFVFRTRSKDGAIEVGRRLEAIDAYLFEEPCPFRYEPTHRAELRREVPSERSACENERGFRGAFKVPLTFVFRRIMHLMLRQSFNTLCPCTITIRNR